MNINILLIVLALLGIWRAWRGFKNGLADEINHLFSLIAALFVIALIIMIITSFKKNDTQNEIIAVIVLIITGIVVHLLGLILKSLRAIAKLPVINLLNSLLGLGIGIAEVIAAAWIMYYVIQCYPTSFGEQIMVWTNENEWLMKLYETNYITKFLADF